MTRRGTARLKTFLAPPRHLLARMRWIFLLLSLIMTVLAVPMVLMAKNAMSLPLRVTALLGLLFLGQRYLSGYRRGGFSPFWTPGEGLAVFVVCYISANPPSALGLLYGGLMFRSLYGSGRSVASVLLTYLVAFYGAVAFVLALGIYNLRVVEVLPPAFGLPLLAATLHIFAATLIRHEQALTREKALRDTGAALAAALDRESVYKAALDAALGLVGNTTPGVRVGFAKGSGEEMTVVASAGYRAAEIRGILLNVHALPAPLRVGFFDKQFLEVENVQAEDDLRKVLGLASGVRLFCLVPLFIQEELKGAIMVTSDSALSAEDKDGLVALSSQVSLALESIALTEDLHRRQSEERFRSLIQNSLDMIVIIGADGVVRYASPSVERVLGYKPEERVGASSWELMHPDELPKLQKLFAEYLNRPGLTPLMELRMQHRDGSWRYIEGAGNNLLEEPNVGGIVFNGRDITERKALEKQLEHQAFHDVLTGLPNRALFMDRLKHTLSRTDRHEESVAVLFLDVDNFQVVNDSLGHQMGDRLLVEVARRLAACARPGDTVARFGGDEFTFLLENLAGADDAVRVAERIVQELWAPFALGEHETVVTPSIGIALSTPGRENLPEELLRNADIALYEAKNRHEVHYALYDTGMHSRVWARLRLESELRRAMDEGQFRIHYQPEVLLETGELFGMEALLRWEHPERGFVPPGEFIPLAEETSLIFPIGQWVLEEASRQARQWRDQHPANPPLKMSVNLSVRQVQRPSLDRQVAQILRETGLDATNLALEITESVMMEDAESAIGALRRLKALGVDLVIDDFGTGYSSMSYLKRFPVDYLKIDRSFVYRLGEDPGDAAIVKATINLAHDLGMKVIAEGVQTEEQLRYLSERGCDLAQGYYFCKPLPAAHISEMLAGHSPRLRR